MHQLLRFTIAVSLVLAGGLVKVHAEVPERTAPVGGALSLLPTPKITKQSVPLDGREIAYQAQAGTLALPGADGKVTAEIFFVAYTTEGVQPTKTRQRPITFVFNGGPGAASAFLHIGAIGPRIIATGSQGNFLAPPQRLINNPDTWLSMTDLVFVDPVGTGYSREAPGEEVRRFWGVDQDAASMGAFIRLFLTQSGRLESPLFLVGESYGGFRVALLARTLQEDIGLRPSGVVLISPALEFMMVRPDEFDPLQWALELPSFAAVKLSHEGVSGTALREKLAEVERYALGDYLVAIASGLEPGRNAASGRVAEITGLPLDLVEKNAARIGTRLFAKEFASKSGSVLSPYDGTIKTDDISPSSTEMVTPDPVLDRSVSVLTPAFVDYVRNELKFATDISYRLLNREVSRNWDYGLSGSQQGYAGAMNDLQKGRSLNPSLGVLIVHGYSDLVTPYMASRYLLNQLPVLPTSKPIRSEVLEGGHMMYFRPDGRRQLRQLAAELYEVTQ